MEIVKKLKRELNNIRMLNAYSWRDLFQQVYLFPFDYYLRKDCKSSSVKNIALFVTLKCNAKCRMCNIYELLNNKDYKEPSFKWISSFINSVKKERPGIILFGGEPFVRPDIFKIISLVKSSKMSCGIFTNGILLNREKINKLNDLKLNYLIFSLQGSKEVHNKIVEIPNAFDKIIKNIEHFTSLKNRNTKVIIHSTISEDNLNSLESIIKLSRELKVDGFRFGHPTFFTEKDIKRNNISCQNIFPGENIKGISYSYNPKEKSKEFISKIIEIKKKYPEIVFSPELSEEEIKDWYSPNFKSKRKCHFVWRGAFVYPNGDVCPCESFYYPMGNINQESFSNVWNNKKYRNFRKQLKKGLLPGCVRCCKL